MKYFLFIVLWVLGSLSQFAQTIQNADLIYDNNIATVQLHPPGDQLAAPIIRLNSTDRLLLSFDDFSAESYEFKYTFVHCTEDWQTSDLDQMDYMDGFFEGDITQYDFSLNAIPPYIHYQLTFPNNQIRLKLSGNYILKVYVDSPDDENVIFTKRFYVIEQLVRVETAIPYYPKNLEYVRQKQQIDLRLFTPDLFSSEPLQRFTVTIQQNGRWDNIKYGLKPTSTMLDELLFDYKDGIVFEGGNQYRNFDMKNYYYRSMYIKEILNEPDGYTVILHANQNRATKPYSTIEDINGRRYITARPTQNPNTEGEYAWVEFALRQPKLKDVDIYILGALNDWQLDDKNKMKWDSRYNMYFGNLYLKQGYYDFLYVVVPKGKKQGSVSIIEGDHWETKNQYSVFVYYLERVPEYYRLVGYSNFNSFDVSFE